MKTIAIMIRERRKDLRMSQREVAVALRMPPRKISRFESGIQEPSLTEAIGLCHVLRMEIGELSKAVSL